MLKLKNCSCSSALDQSSGQHSRQKGDRDWSDLGSPGKKNRARQDRSGWWNFLNNSDTTQNHWNYISPNTCWIIVFRYWEDEGWFSVTLWNWVYLNTDWSTTHRLIRSADRVWSRPIIPRIVPWFLVRNDLENSAGWTGKDPMIWHLMICLFATVQEFNFKRLAWNCIV